MTVSATGTGQQQKPVASKLKITLASLVAGFGVAVLSYAVERWLEVPPAQFRAADLADQIFAGILAGLAVYVIWMRGRRAQLLDRHRFELISASTQQIRDALQLITDSAVPGTPQQGVIIYAVDHIEWVLQEVLPAVHQKPEEVRDRIKNYGMEEENPQMTSGAAAGDPNDLPSDRERN